jgi:hypothetical protein
VFKPIEKLGVGVMSLDEHADQLSGVETEIHRPQLFAKSEVAFAQAPFAKRAKFAVRGVCEDRITSIKQINAAIEFAGACFGTAMGALGNNA